MSAKPYILIAEDDKFNSKIYQKRLEKDGYEIKIVPNGQDVINEVTKRKPDLVLLDLIMPVMDGFDVLSNFKTSGPKGMKVIVLSNLGQDEDIKKAMDLGASDYLAKAENTLQDISDKIKKHLSL